MWPDLKKNSSSTHTISNLRFHQKWITCSIHYHIPLRALFQSHEFGFGAAFLRPCVSLKWHFGTIGWSWLSCNGALRAGQATKGWPMSVIFYLECCEHKKGPIWPQTRPLAFNCLRIPFCTPILSPPSSHHPYYYHLQYHYHHEKSCSKQLEFRVFESYSPTQL